MSNIALWQKDTELSVIPSDIHNMSDLMTYANPTNLTQKQMTQIVEAYDRGSYEMSASYAWDKTISKLRKSLESLGVDFVGELLQKNNVDEFTSIDDILSERGAIELAERLGIVGKTGGLKLRHAQELVSHYVSGEAEDEIDSNDAFSIIKTCIQYILSEQKVDVAVAFSNFRKRLLSETISLGDSDVKQIIASPLFYLRTVCSILLTAIKKEKGAHQEHALTNLNVIIVAIWPCLGEKDKYQIGETFRDVSASGDDVATRGLKQALSKVHGFDYVPETLRSTTFKDQANKVIEIHYNYNNFYNEPAAVRTLSNLGSIIPKPAFQECVDAYLLVYMGNYYGVSNEATPISRRELVKISIDRWKYYFTDIIHQDQYILSNMSTVQQISRLRDILVGAQFTGITGLPRDNQLLYDAIMNNDYNKAKKISEYLYDKLY